MTQKPEWKRFEEAVAAFAAALDPAATVKHDLRLPDRHHGRRRQRDVWIEAKIGGHFPVSVLVSCKRTKRKLNSADVDAFNGELESSHARVGVMYSYSGFTKGAVDKGRVLGIPCCQLYQGKGPEIPAVLFFSSYCCTPQVSVTLAENPADFATLNTWNDLFSLPMRSKSGEAQLIDSLTDAYHHAEKEAVEAVAAGRRIPQPFARELRVQRENSDMPLRVVITGRWKFYRAKIEAYEVNGSYEFTHGDFKGQLATPAIDRFSSEPGPGWDLLDQPPEPRGNVAIIILHKGNVKDALLESMGQKVIKAGNPTLQPDADRA
jgi:hypothetical protein